MNEGRPWVTAAALSASVVLGCHLLLPVRYAVNDDFGAEMVLSGADGLPAAAEVPFLSRMAAELLVHLYAWQPTWPWFGAGVVATGAVGVLLTARVWLGATEGRPWLRGLSLPGLLVCWLHASYLPTFTSSALLVELGVFASCWLGLVRSRAVLPPAAVLAGVALAYLWRWQLTLVASVFAAPVAICWLTLKPPKVTAGEGAASRRSAWATWSGSAPIVLLLPAVLLVVLDRGWDAAATRGGEAQEYRRLYRARALFHDSPLGRPEASTPAALDAAGWHPDDYRLFRELWVLYDDQLFNAEAVNRYLDATARSVSWWSGLLDQIRSAGSQYRYWLVIAALSLLGVASWPGTRRPPEETRGLERGQRLARGAVALAVALPLAVMLALRFVPRVAVPTLVYVQLAVVIGCHCRRRDSAHGDSAHGDSPLGDSAVGVASPAGWYAKGRGVLSVVSCLLATLLAARLVALESAGLVRDRAARAFARQALSRLLEAGGRSPRLIVRLEPGRGFRHDLMGPLESRTPGSVPVLPAGWQTGSPRYRRFLASLGCDGGRDLLSWAIDRPAAQFVLLLDADGWPSEAQRILQLWQSYYRRHIDQQVTFRLERIERDSQGRRSLVYQVTRQETPPPAGIGASGAESSGAESPGAESPGLGTPDLGDVGR